MYLYPPEGAKSRTPEGEMLKPGEYRTLMAQCSILIMIATIVVWIIAQ